MKPQMNATVGTVVAVSVFHSIVGASDRILGHCFTGILRHFIYAFSGYRGKDKIRAKFITM
jgi:hypothetical protein